MDWLVVGGGIVGLTVASELRRRHPGSRVQLIEKEPSLGLHASGRNSGVLHAGFYYSADSLKARFSRDGNRELTEYCIERGLPINRCGKLVVTSAPEEADALDELLRRGRDNGVEVYRVSEREAAELEPTAQTVGSALFSPATATVDPTALMQSLASDARDSGVELRTGVEYRGRKGRVVLTSAGGIEAGFVVNAAGLYADRIARDYGFARSYGILPFRGLYLRYRGTGRVPRRHLYPVPPPEYPFLGAHWTVTVTGEVMLGPTAIPALWREHYGGVANFRLSELLEIVARESGLLWRNSFGFRRLASTEVRKYRKRHLLFLGRRLVRPGIGRGPWAWGKPGVRAQLLDVSTGRLVMDFRCEGNRRSLHVLNAVSPAFTCAFPFARHAVDEAESLLA